MAVKSISTGKLVIKELDPRGEEFTENVAYIKENIAGASSERINNITNAVSTFVSDLVACTDNTLKDFYATYEVRMQSDV